MELNLNITDSKDIKKAISGVCNKLNINLDSKLQNDYQNGKYPKLLSYEKIDKSRIVIPVIQKYLIGAQTYLNQPTQYFDIFRLCRPVILIQILNQSLGIIIDKVENYQDKLKKLCKETEYDPFESILFELFVASNYAQLNQVKNIVFLDETGSKSPDIEVATINNLFYIECKKFDRFSNLVPELRKIAVAKAGPIVQVLLKNRISAIIELIYFNHPNEILEKDILKACNKAIITSTLIINKNFSIKIIPLDNNKIDGYILFPSPKCYWDRYEYKEKGDWDGIYSTFSAKFARIESIVEKKEYSSSWIDDFNWEIAIKWKVRNDKLVWKQKRLSYTRIFKGLNQLKTKGPNSILHVWFERKPSKGHSKNELLHFLQTLRSNSNDIFSWLLFNETIFDVSLQGIYDLIEHTHIIKGPSAKTKFPLVTNIFTKDNLNQGIGEFGKGHPLPDIDDVCDQTM